MDIKKAARILGSLGGKSKSKKKQAAARKNGKLYGGRRKGKANARKN